MSIKPSSTPAAGRRFHNLVPLRPRHPIGSCPDMKRRRRPLTCACSAGAPKPTPPPCTINHDAHPQRHTQRQRRMISSSYGASVAYPRTPPAGPHTAIVHSRPLCLASQCATALLSAALPLVEVLTAHVCCVALGLRDTIPLRSTTRMCAFVLPHSSHDPIVQHRLYCMPSMHTGRSPSPAPRSPTPVACIVTAFTSTSTRLTAAPIAHQRPLPHFDPGLSSIACAALVPTHHARRENAAAGGQRATQPQDRHTGRAELLRARREQKRSAYSITASAMPLPILSIERFCAPAV
ncbi:hypothetical protein B0H14DRAFT_3490571 [Mycena olivaceomarginata]|nr:hypothetical protein B0H14DRAFT_3490571 [Mycena olivaceomarginata]